MKELILLVLLTCRDPIVPFWLFTDYDESYLYLPPTEEEQDSTLAAAIHYSRCESTDFEVLGGE